MIVKTMSATPLETVQVASPQVWLRKNIEKTTYENAQGEDVKAIDAWEADELSFIDPTVTADYAADHFDELWAAHEDDGMTAAERIAALQARVDEQSAALLELGDLIGGE